MQAFFPCFLLYFILSLTVIQAQLGLLAFSPAAGCMLGCWIKKHFIAQNKVRRILWLGFPSMIQELHPWLFINALRKRTFFHPYCLYPYLDFEGNVLPLISVHFVSNYSCVSTYMQLLKLCVFLGSVCGGP